MTSFDIVALAASAGGLNALTQVLQALPADFAAGIVVVQHLDPRHRSLMAEILGRRTGLKVKEASQGSRVAAGTVMIAPPNNHLLVNQDGSLTLTQTELVHFLRPSADLLFESTAAAYRERAIAVVLSGRCATPTPADSANRAAAPTGRLSFPSETFASCIRRASASARRAHPRRSHP